MKQLLKFSIGTLKLVMKICEQDTIIPKQVLWNVFDKLFRSNWEFHLGSSLKKMNAHTSCCVCRIGSNIIDKTTFSESIRIALLPFRITLFHHQSFHQDFSCCANHFETCSSEICLLYRNINTVRAFVENNLSNIDSNITCLVRLQKGPEHGQCLVQHTPNLKFIHPRLSIS